MKQASQLMNNSQLRQFSPLEKLSEEDSHELLRTSNTVHLPSGTSVFNGNDNGKQLFYLIKGKIELRDANSKAIIKAGTKQARQPIGRHLSGHESATALGDCILISFDADMLDLLLNWTNPNAYVVDEIDPSQGHEWLSRLLKSRGLLRLTERQINTLLERMHEVHFNKGDVVISQDDDDGFFYIIKQGRATVSRKPMPLSKDINLAYLNEGDAFGEESILTNMPRGATVTMDESGNLMRLSKQDFSEFLAQPLLDTISWEAAQLLDATFLDIRLEEEFNACHIPGSINTPLPLLRLKLKQLQRNKKYIVYCNDGSRSAVATFLLNQHGFSTYTLDGGIATVLPDLASAQNTSDISASGQAVEQSATQVTSQGSEFCSLADYWGATVDTTIVEPFADSDAVGQVEKTKSTPTVNEAKFTSTPPPASTPAPTRQISSHAPVFAEYKPRKPVTVTWQKKKAKLISFSSNKILRKAILACGVVSIATAYAFSENTQSKLKTTTTLPTTPVHTETTAVTRQHPTNITPTQAPVSAVTESDLFNPAPDESQPVSAPEALLFTADTIQSDTVMTTDMTDDDATAVAVSPATDMTNESQEPLDPATRGFIE